MTTYYIDPELGNDSTGNGTSGNPWKTMSSTTPVAGDLVKVKKSPDPTLVGNATFTNGSATITLASAVTSNINMCETAWTASTNVTTGANTTNRVEGTNSANCAIAAGFTTGKIAYSTTVNTDYSAYQQISFVITPTVTIAANTLTLSLCSDTTGDTAVNTFTIPALPIANQNYYLTFDNAGALGSSIQSISLNALLDPGTVTIYLDNIIACKSVASADSLTLNSMIGKNISGDKIWHPIKSINGTTVILAHYFISQTSPYYGTSETTSLYKRETFKIITSTNINNISCDASTTGNITFECGYSSDWSAVTGETFFDGSICNPGGGGANNVGINIQANKRGIIIKNIGITRCAVAIGVVAPYNTIDNIHISATQVVSSITGYYPFILNNLYATSTWSQGIGSNNVVGPVTGSNWVIKGAVGYGITLGYKWNLTNVNVSGCSSGGINTTYSVDSKINDSTFSNNLGADIMVVGDGRQLTLFNTSLNSSVDVSYTTNPAVSTVGAECDINSVDHNGTSGTYKAYRNGAIIDSETSIRHTASGKSMKITISNRPVENPIRYKIGSVALLSGITKNINIWAYKSATGVYGSLIIKRNYGIGITSELSVSITPTSATTWEQSSNLSVTPTADGVIDIFVECYADSTGSLYIDDMSIS